MSRPGLLAAGLRCLSRLKAKFGNVHYRKWPTELVQRQPAALEQARTEPSNQIGLACFAQFLVFRQADRLRAHAHRKGLTLMGDLPFFVSPDSSDVWANPELFLLDEQRRPRFLAGVPPDCFSSQGQLWGNPVYNWDTLRKSGYRWWIARLRSLLSHVDVIRLDHFRGFTAAWHVPAGAPTAQTGSWVPHRRSTEINSGKRRDIKVLRPYPDRRQPSLECVVLQREQLQLASYRATYCAFIHLSDPVTLTATSEKNTRIGLPSALPRRSVEISRGPAFFWPAHVAKRRFGFLGPPRW